MCHRATNKYGIYGSNDGCYWRLRPLYTPHTMSDFHDCAHSCIRTASERQEALQTLLSFICRGAACLLPCWHNVRRPSRTLFRKRHNTTHNIYGHLVIWSFGQNEEKKCCQNLYSIIYNIYYTIAQITHFHFLKMTKGPNDQMTTFLPLMTS